MPTLTGTPVIRRAWRHRGEPTRIHYIANGGTRDRHLYVDAGNPLYDILDEALSAAGYTGPSYPGRGDVPPVEEPGKCTEPGRCEHGFPLGLHCHSTVT